MSEKMNKRALQLQLAASVLSVAAALVGLSVVGGVLYLMFKWFFR